MFIFEQNFKEKCSIADPSMMTFRVKFEAKAALFIKILLLVKSWDVFKVFTLLSKVRFSI